MQFLYPGLFWALGAISIPILVHLFNFRKFKKVQFSNVDFLKEIKQETKSKSRLKHLLILASRILALGAIVFAFAQPFIPTGTTEVKTGKNTVGIYVDNSFSMESESENGNILEIAKNKALEVVNYHQPTDMFQLLTNDFEGRHQRWLTQEEISEMITEIDFSPQSRVVSEVVSRHKDLSLQEEADSRKVYVLSDLQESVTDIGNLASDTAFQYNFLPTASAFDENLYIDSVWFSSPSRNLKSAEILHVRIKNTLSSAKENVPLKLYVNGTQKSVISFTAEPGVEKDTVLTFSNSEAGFMKGRVSLDDYPVTFDDDFYFGFEVAERTNVLEISSSSSDVFKKLFNQENEYVYSKFNANQIDYNRFSEFDLIIMNQLSFISGGLKQELDKFSKSGGTLVIIPSEDADMSSYNSLFSICGADLYTEKKFSETKISQLNLDHFVYKPVFDSKSRNMSLPKVNSYFGSTNRSRKNRDVLATLQNGAPAISYYENGGSSLYVFYISLSKSSSDLVENAMMPYTFSSIANNAKAASKPYIELGEESVFKLKSSNSGNAETVVKMQSEAGIEFIPEFRRTDGSFEIFPENQAQTAGIYSVTVDQEKIGSVGINYNRKESEISYYSPIELEKDLQDQGLESSSVITSGMETLADSIEETNEGKTLWKMFVILALMFLGIEIILIKFWK